MMFSGNVIILKVPTYGLYLSTLVHEFSGIYKKES